MTDWNAVSAFMANVVAWPGSTTDPGFVNLHYSMPNLRHPEKGLLKGMGWPFRSVDTIVERAAWLQTVDKFKDVWFCTSLQSMQGKNAKGNPKAIRLAANAIAQKAIWIDIDVGPPEAGKKPKYPDVPTALKAALLFATTVGLPAPSAIVYSGGGIHIYWISKDALSPAEWLPYASGLKQLLLANNILCDTGLTTDIARILRFPGTLNYKYDPPKPVTLAPLPLTIYDFKKLDFLKQFAAPTPSAPAAGHSIYADGVSPATFGKVHPAFANIKEPDLNAGIDKTGDNLLDPFPIFRQCGFLRKALTTGGKDYDQTLWMYSVLCSTFMENGNDIAHRISQGHAAYTKDDTQALYDRKMAERHDRGIGYPSCATIAGAGCASCATCPLFPKGKSPLNIRPAPSATVTATVTPGLASPQAAKDCLPPTFELNGDGIICKVLETEDEGELTTQMVPLFQAVLTDFWLQKGVGEYLNFTTTVDKGFSEQVAIPLGEISAQGFKSYLGKQRVLIDVRGVRFLEEFFLSVIGRLRAFAAAQTAVPFGWYEENGARRGFVFNGKIMLDDGSERPCGPTDPNTARKYTPKGTIEEWMKAAETVTMRKRPELTTIMLMAFASPLLALTGNKNSMMMAAYGSDSGAGKSSAYTVGLSVWGHPILTKGTKTQTANNITTVMKTIRNLPFYWDELTNDIEREKVASVMHDADGGKEKGRNIDGTRTQEEGTWKLMLHYASNGSYREFLRQRNMNTVASVVRVLEWEVKKIDGGPGHLANADAELLLDLANNNYGHMGVKYAKFLALNHVAIAKELRDKSVEAQKNVRGTDTERFWYTTIAMMTLAAKYARHMGLDVEPAEIETFMYKVYDDNLMVRDEFFGGGNGKVDNSETVLTRYLKERQDAERGIWTNYMHNKQGKPAKPVTILKGPTQARNQQGGIEFRFALENRILAIAQTDFNDWLKLKKQAETQIYSALKQTHQLTRQKLHLLSGTVHDTGREECIVLQVGADSPLWNLMTGYANPETRKEMEADKPADGPVVDTGFAIDTNGLATPESVAAFVAGAVRA